MSHTVNPVVLRLGYKLNWTFLHNYIYISKTFRFTLLINAILFGFLRKYNYTLVKYFVNLETTKCKILVVALRNFGVGRKLFNFSFFKWSKAYKVAFFKIKKKLVRPIKSFRLRLFLLKFDFNKFLIYKSIVKEKYSNKAFNKLRNVLPVFSNFKQFRLKKKDTHIFIKIL